MYVRRTHILPARRRRSLVAPSLLAALALYITIRFLTAICLLQSLLCLDQRSGKRQQRQQYGPGAESLARRQAAHLSRCTRGP